MNSAVDIWKKVLDLLSKKLTTTTIETWFSDCTAIDFQNTRLVLHTPSAFKKDIIEQWYADSIKSVLHDLFSCDFELTVLAEDELDSYKKSASNNNNKTSIYDSEEYTFEHFIVGNSNKFAHAAAKAVADGQTKNYNPLFIYGESGLGKTHLLHAIRHKIREDHPEYNIVYVKGDDFTNELIQAIQSGKNVEFREKYRNVDLFLIDDVQFIAGKISTQEEFFNTFNTLYEANRQIVLTSDRPPREISRLEDRLRTRFESGLLADIQPPDYETRVAIIRNKSSQLGLSLENDVTDYIANNITSNVRQIEGAVKKIMAYSQIMENKITPQSVAKVIKDMFRSNTEYAPTPDLIIEETAKYFSITSEDIKGKQKTKNKVTARHIAMYLIIKIVKLSLVDTAKIFGRDHTTVMYATQKVEDSIRSSDQYAQLIKDIESNINARR